MGTLYKEVENGEIGNSLPQKVNFGWFSEALHLFKEDIGLWISAVVIGVFGPALFDGFVLLAYRLTNHLSGLPRDAYLHLPIGLGLGIGILNLIYFAFIAGGFAAMALKKVQGHALAFGDIFSGAPHFGNMLVWSVFVSVMVNIGFALLILPGIFVGALLLPSFALIADNVGTFASFSRSARGMQKDRVSAMGFAFILAMVMTASALVGGLGLLVTLPMLALISALAYRDMVGIPSMLRTVSPESSLDEPLLAQTSLKWSGGQKFSLSGEPLDDQGNVIAPKT